MRLSLLASLREHRHRWRRRLSGTKEGLYHPCYGTLILLMLYRKWRHRKWRRNWNPTEFRKNQFLTRKNLKGLWKRHDLVVLQIFLRKGSKKEGEKTTESSDADKEKQRGKPENGDKKKNKREKWSFKWKDVASVAKEALDSHVKTSSNNPSSTEKSSSNRNKSGSPSSSSSSSSSTSASTRPERYKLVLEEGRTMKLSSLKKELSNRGISTSSFFEKSDLVKAYANAIADHVKVNTVNTSCRNDEIFDPSYRNVIMHAFDPSTILARDIIIDITETM